MDGHPQLTHDFGGEVPDGPPGARLPGRPRSNDERNPPALVVQLVLAWEEGGQSRVRRTPIAFDRGCHWGVSPLTAGDSRKSQGADAGSVLLSRVCKRLPGMERRRIGMPCLWRPLSSGHEWTLASDSRKRRCRDRPFPARMVRPNGVSREDPYLPGVYSGRDRGDHEDPTASRHDAPNPLCISHGAARSLRASHREEWPRGLYPPGGGGGVGLHGLRNPRDHQPKRWNHRLRPEARRRDANPLDRPRSPGPPP